MSAAAGLNSVALLCIVLGVCGDLPHSHAQAAPSQQLLTPYSSQSAGFEARANLKRLLTAQLGRAAADGRTGPAASHLRRPALVAPQSAPSVPPPQPQSPAAVRVSRPRYVEAPFDADDGSSSAEDEANEAQIRDGDDAVGDEDDDDLPAPQPQPVPVPSPPSDAGEAEDEDDEDENENVEEQEQEEEAPEQEVYNPHRDNFYDLNPDGSYVFGYSLPNGVRRYERSYYSKLKHSRVVEGFYAQPRQMPQGLVSELRCYRSDINGYQPLSVEYLRRPPRVQRYETPDVDCLKCI